MKTQLSVGILLLIGMTAHCMPIKIEMLQASATETNTTFSINGLDKSNAEFWQLMHKVAKVDTNQAIIVSARHTNTFGAIIGLMERLRDIGLTNVHLVYGPVATRPDLSRRVTIQGLEPKQNDPPDVY